MLLIKSAKVFIHFSHTIPELSYSFYIFRAVILGSDFVFNHKRIQVKSDIIMIVEMKKSRESPGPSQANLCLRAFRHDKF